MKTTLLALAAACSLAGCAHIKTYERPEQPMGRTLTTYVGGTVLRIQRTGDLPNAFGRADLFGGKVNQGFTEVRFQGLAPDGRSLFRVTEVAIASSETTMSRYGVSQANFYATGTGNSVHGTVSVYEPPKGSSEVLPPNTSAFALAPRVKDFQVGPVHVELVNVTDSAVSYRLTTNDTD